ncbi:TPA: hypothetical protein HIF34_004655 [Escherichia coli]|nr:hypothetical protein [Escherichia coli]HEC3578726.1 hypothetical protein [Escherichia coli]
MCTLSRLYFLGQLEDADSGLYYKRFRYYDCETEQYFYVEPIGLNGGLNLYAYAPNPLSYIDPLGLKCATLEYHHRQKPGKITNLRELKRQIRGQIRAFNKILKEEGMEGLKRRISNYTANVEKQGRDYVRKLGSAGDGKAWLHEPDMRTGGLPSDVSRTGLSRENSILGGNAPQIADQILSMSNDVDKLTAKLILSGISP